MKNKNHNQQGDVCLLSVKKLPDGCKLAPMDKRGVVLAEGEITGHYHGIEDNGVSLMVAPNGKRFVVNNGKRAAVLRHQEHNPVRVPPGIHEIGIVREKDWFTDMVRDVKD
jgi:hypothetical protein